MKLPPVLTGIVLDPVAGTLDFSALGAGFDPRTVLGVLHEPTNRWVFAKGRPGLGYTAITGSVMTLAADTSDLSPGPLTGFRDDGVLIATDARLEACRALLATATASLSNLSTALGSPADVAAGSDTAVGSLIAKVTRLLATQTSIAALLGAIRDRLPAALVGGRLSIDGSGVTQPISAVALPLPAGAATDAKLEAMRALIAGSTVTSDVPGTLAAGGSAAPVAANMTRQFLELTNTGSNPLAYRWGAAATATVGHILGAGQSVRYDAKVPTAALNLFSTGGTTFHVTTG